MSGLDNYVTKLCLTQAPGAINPVRLSSLLQLPPFCEYSRCFRIQLRFASFRRDMGPLYLSHKTTKKGIGYWLHNGGALVLRGNIRVWHELQHSQFL